jgi:dTDP-4-amino-4,6-dideoxygalactose transaminase
MDTPTRHPPTAPDDDRIALSDPDIGHHELESVLRSLGAPRLSSGPQVEAFEAHFADWVGRRYAVAVASGTIGTWLALRALGIGPGDEVIASVYGWHQVAHAVALCGATPVFADINYWSGCLSAERVADKITGRTRALLVGNANGHPAAWREFQALAEAHGLPIVEDSTEAIGSRYLGCPTGSFGKLAVFDFSQPSALCCGEGGMVVTDDAQLATELSYLRSHRVQDRQSVSIGARVPLQAGISDVTAALGLAQLDRIDEILARRKAVEVEYHAQMQTFEGIKPPYLAADVDEVHWMLYVVHLGRRFTASARAQLVDDMDTNAIEAAAYCQPLHQQFFYRQLGFKRGQLPNAERIGDRALALPLHGHLDAEQVAYIVKTLKDASINVGAGAAIY